MQFKYTFFESFKSTLGQSKTQINLITHKWVEHFTFIKKMGLTFANTPRLFFQPMGRHPWGCPGDDFESQQHPQPASGSFHSKAILKLQVPTV